MKLSDLKESDLSQPVTSYLEENGYSVQCEVHNTDIVAQKDDEILAIELKKSFNATLLIQAVERQKFADSVYVAIPRPNNLRRSKNFKGMCHLLKRLGLGLILVSFLKTKTRIDVLIHPSDYEPRKSNYKKKAILREVAERSGSYNKGGITRKKIITAYKEKVIQIACYLEKFGPLSPKDLKKMGCPEKTGSMLYKDFYGWFERVEKGVYKLHENGAKALKEHAEVAQFFFQNISEDF
jgi:hypothetical protein